MGVLQIPSFELGFDPNLTGDSLEEINFSSFLGRLIQCFCMSVGWIVSDYN
jgi:hypothetical protein